MRGMNAVAMAACVGIVATPRWVMYRGLKIVGQDRLNVELTESAEIVIEQAGHGRFIILSLREAYAGDQPERYASKQQKQRRT
jgi:hypothetical protein